MIADATAGDSAPLALRHALRACAAMLLLFILACVLALVSLRGQQLPAPVAPATEALAPLRIELREPLADGLGEIALRPLFWEGRMPLGAETELEQAAGPAARTSQFDGAELLGVFSSGADQGVIIRLGGARRRVMVGESVEGWELISVEETLAHWRNGPARGGERVLQLSRTVGAPSR